MATDPRIFLASLSWRALETPHVHALWRFMQSTPNVRFVPRTGDALVDRGRAMLASRFLRETEDDVLLAVDSDIVFRAEDAREICAQAMTDSIVAGVYITRSNERPVPAVHFERAQTVEFGTNPTPVPCLYPAGGFVAVHLRVFQAILDREALPLCHASKPWAFYPFYTPFTVPGEDGDTLYLSEDWAFFERARRAGFPSYLNPKVRLAHLGSYGYHLEDMVDLANPTPTVPMKITRTTGGGYHSEALIPEPAELPVR